ncbi:3-deoxy-manno-octulosonate cytidylyltransferase [Vibrio aerogenes CECT 7868]|uniref:3-deoxy-manno-octulosonate cytidylyltransferase n=1 Tax=Vibrio aerogenes CECT 7868 TaxID=1216006 RepID=A0A1M5X752_9VIBR|nr:3-deoxy-manno-octulosonate cytidylyltransferase [Vibrio aerogenes]SHH95472.1 3-deoxy-manno-octulosonate cytidylyltransferase [Vibrio aerogenes CECT 7868]
MSFTVVIPARYQSSRLPGKPLADICGRTMIQRVYDQAMQSGAQRVIVATDDPRIEQVVTSFGGQVCMTSPDHESGTERLAEVVATLSLPEEHVVVNVQGDEPLIPPGIISQVAENLQSHPVPMATLAVQTQEAEDIFNPNIVKVVTDQNGYALYFSRAAIPWDRDCYPHDARSVQHPVLRHIGIYAYRAGFIQTYVDWNSSQLEKIECLEQLRVLWHGEKIHVDIAHEAPHIGIDTPEDLEQVRHIIAKQNRP